MTGAPDRNATESVEVTPDSARKIFFVIPIHDDAQRAGGAIADVARRFGGRPWRAIVVDDRGRADGALDELSARFPRRIKTIVHEQARGAPDTLFDGGAAAATTAADDDFILWLESDGAGDPLLHVELLARLEAGCDLVIASRRRADGRWDSGTLRGWLGRWGNRALSWLAPYPGVTDYTAPFRGCRAGLLKRALADLGRRAFDGSRLAAGAALLLRCLTYGPTVAEIPYQEPPDPRPGGSSFALGPALTDYARWLMQSDWPQLRRQLRSAASIGKGGVDRAAFAPSDRILASSQTLCPVCERPLRLTAWADDGRVLTEARCPEHGRFVEPHWASPALFRRLNATRNRTGKSTALAMTPSAEHARWAKSVFVDLTTRCNLNCGLCFAQANQPQAAFEPTADELTAALAPIEGQPTMCLCGGEPTLREDLPQVIRTLKAHGSATKLFTNGIELTDPAKMRALAEAGLDWLCLQYDGPDPDVCRRFRGRDLTEVRAQALALARQLGLKVMLPCALKRNGNLSHVWRVIDAGLSDPAVMHVGIAACSLIGRHGEEDAAARVTIGETLAAIEAQSGGRLTARDFLAFRTLAYWLHRLTGHSGFFQRNCFFQTLLFRCRDGYWPATRFLDPRFAAARPADAARLLAAFAAVWRWDRIARDPRLKLITVERFHDELLLNLDELTHCNKCYLTPAGFLPMCAYNRRRERLAGSPPEQT